MFHFCRNSGIMFHPPLCFLDGGTLKAFYTQMNPYSLHPKSVAGRQVPVCLLQKTLKLNYKLSQSALFIFFFLDSSRSWRIPNKRKLLWVPGLLIHAKWSYHTLIYFSQHKQVDQWRMIKAHQSAAVSAGGREWRQEGSGWRQLRIMSFLPFH